MKCLLRGEFAPAKPGGTQFHHATGETQFRRKRQFRRADRRNEVPLKGGLLVLIPDACHLDHGPCRWVWRKRKRRASGGCLGTERRWRTWHAAKSPGDMPEF